MRRFLSICGITAALAGMGAVVALAGVTKIGGSITVRTTATGFAGRVKSSRHFCRVNRLVVVRRQTPGKDPEVGRDHTNRRGRYSVETPGPVTGAFYARMARKLKIVSGNGIVCRPRQTNVIHID
jgi:hypothetical protein